MRSGSDWYARYPTDYLGGVQGLSSDEHAAYSIILDLIYQHGGSVNNDPAWFAGWVSDMGPAKMKRAVSGLIARGKLVLEGDQLTQHRAREQARTKEDLRQKNRENGRAGGQARAAAASENEPGNSEETDRKLSKNRQETEQKPAEVYQFPKPVPYRNNNLAVATASRREEKTTEEGSSGGGCEREVRRQILDAIGVDPVSGITGPSARMIGTEVDMASARRWAVDLGLTVEQIVTVIRETMARKSDGPPSSFRFFDKPMSRFAGEIAAIRSDRLKPQAATRRSAPHDDRNFNDASREIERRLAAGEIDFGSGESNW